MLMVNNKISMILDMGIIDLRKYEASYNKVNKEDTTKSYQMYMDDLLNGDYKTQNQAIKTWINKELKNRIMEDIREGIELVAEDLNKGGLIYVSDIKVEVRSNNKERYAKFYIDVTQDKTDNVYDNDDEIYKENISSALMYKFLNKYDLLYVFHDR